jgi:NitT/TauT family transport system ATP-binding protein
MTRSTLSAEAQWALALENVDKVFANGTVALRAIDLAVAPGEFVTLLGPSGCGKSTILRLIAGLGSPSTGSTRVFGTDPVTARAGGRVAYVFQDATLLPWLTVAKNVALPLTLARRPRAEITAAVDRVLRLVGLESHANDLPRQLSGGMRMRASIARALIGEPELLLMDEPFGALDEITRQTLQSELREIWANVPGTTVIFVTHNVFEAAFLATRVVVLGARPGRIVADLSTGEASTDALSTDAPREHSHPFRSSDDFAHRVARISDALALASTAVAA